MRRRIMNMMRTTEEHIVALSTHKHEHNTKEQAQPRIDANYLAVIRPFPAGIKVVIR